MTLEGSNFLHDIEEEGAVKQVETCAPVLEIA